VLTDYHLHLRPDDDLTPPFEGWFTDANVDRYLAAARAAGIEELGVSEHVYRFRESLEVWDHPFWRRYANDDLDAYCEFVRSTPLRLGIELDFVPGAEAGAPFALSSDAHAPEQVGDAYGAALELLEGIGVGEICVFEGRSRRMEPLGPAPNRENGGR
jgi:histidinol phosphatase-like PHP family hydrolase